MPGPSNISDSSIKCDEKSVLIKSREKKKTPTGTLFHPSNIQFSSTPIRGESKSSIKAISTSTLAVAHQSPSMQIYQNQQKAPAQDYQKHEEDREEFIHRPDIQGQTDEHVEDSEPFHSPHYGRSILGGQQTNENTPADFGRETLFNSSPSTDTSPICNPDVSPRILSLPSYKDTDAANPLQDSKPTQGLPTAVTAASNEVFSLHSPLHLSSADSLTSSSHTNSTSSHHSITGLPQTGSTSKVQPGQTSANQGPQGVSVPANSNGASNTFHSGHVEISEIELEKLQVSGGHQRVPLVESDDSDQIYIPHEAKNKLPTPQAFLKSISENMLARHILAKNLSADKEIFPSAIHLKLSGISSSSSDRHFNELLDSPSNVKSDKHVQIPNQTNSQVLNSYDKDSTPTFHNASDSVVAEIPSNSGQTRQSAQLMTNQIDGHFGSVVECGKIQGTDRDESKHTAEKDLALILPPKLDTYDTDKCRPTIEQRNPISKSWSDILSSTNVSVSSNSSRGTSEGTKSPKHQTPLDPTRGTQVVLVKHHSQGAFEPVSGSSSSRAIKSFTAQRTKVETVQQPLVPNSKAQPNVNVRRSYGRGDSDRVNRDSNVSRHSPVTKEKIPTVAFLPIQPFPVTRSNNNVEICEPNPVTKDKVRGNDASDLYTTMPPSSVAGHVLTSSTKVPVHPPASLGHTGEVDKLKLL